MTEHPSRGRPGDRISRIAIEATDWHAQRERTVGCGRSREVNQSGCAANLAAQSRPVPLTGMAAGNLVLRTRDSDVISSCRRCEPGSSGLGYGLDL